MKIIHYPLKIAQWFNSHIVIFFLLWSLWLAFLYFGLGPASYVLVHDNGDAQLPDRLALGAAQKDGQLGYWNPTRVSGADRQSSWPISDVDNLLYFALPGWLAYGLTMWLQRFVAGYFTFYLLRDALELDVLPSLYAGLAYSLFAQRIMSGNVMGFTLYDRLTLPGLPFILWGLGRIDAKPMRWSCLYAAGMGLFFGVTSSYVFVPFLLMCILFWFLFIIPKIKPAFGIKLLVFLGAWFLGEFPVMWAGLRNASLSHRADWTSDSPLAKSWLDQVAFVFYGLVRDNIVPLGLSFMGLVASRGRDRRLVLLSVALVLCLVFVLVYPFSIRMVIDRYFGFLSGFKFERVYLLVPFLAIVSGGIGLHLIAQKWREWPLTLIRQALRLSPYMLLVIVAMGLVGERSLLMQRRMLREIGDGRNFATLYQHPDLQQLAQNRAQLAPFRVVTVADKSAKPDLHPAYAWAYGLQSADGYVTMYPQRYQDYWEQVIGPLIEVDQNRHDYFHYWGNRAYLFSPLDGFAQPEIRPGDYYDLELLSLANVRFIISPLLLQDENLTLLPSDARDEQLMWVDRSNLAKLRGMLSGEYPGIPLYIYENHQVLPRFFLASQVQLFDEPTQVLAALGQASHDDLRSTAYVQRADVQNAPLDSLAGGEGEVSLKSYFSDRIELQVSAESASILIVTHNYHPDWRAWVDGAGTELFPVDHTFQGIYVQGGQHKVVLEYRPPYAIR